MTQLIATDVMNQANKMGWQLRVTPISFESKLNQATHKIGVGCSWSAGWFHNGIPKSQQDFENAMKEYYDAS